MKKLLTAVLALMLVFSVCVPAFAADNSAQINGYNSSDISAEGVIVPAGEPNIKISADITWDELLFVYKDGGKKWNPETHQEENLAGGWETTQKKITVTNHSNTDIVADISFESAIDGLVGAFEGDTSMKLASAVGTARDEAPNGTVLFGVSGTRVANRTAVTIGTLTVKLSTQSGEPVYTIVNTTDELIDAANAGVEFIRLESSIFYTSSSPVAVNKNCTIDMNGRTITVMSMASGALFEVSAPDYFTLKNGTVAFQNHNRDLTSVTIKNTAAVNIENCTLNAIDRYVLDIRKSAVTIKDSVLNFTSPDYPNKNAVLVQSGSLTLGGNVEINAKNAVIKWDEATVNALPGTYNFDPTDFVDSNVYDVTSDAEAATWTVTEK